MLAILGGFGAALCWATSSMASARASRAIGAWATLGWVMLIGTALSVPATILWGGGADLTGEALLLLVISGAANVVGLLLAYVAFQRGKVAVIASILATEGATAAVISIVFGEQLAIGAVVVLGALAGGVVLASAAGDDEEGAAAEPGGLAAESHPPSADGSAIPFALAAVACFGINLYATGRLGATLPIVWSLLPARLGGAVFVALPLLAMGRLTLVRPAVPFV
ncbi:MAG TPA: DMT family transporter, partial [Candidatus Limnocylindrales bacterium]|nr:DMT family transporter [Candidatus Limnocylindrales bacterium]